MTETPESATLPAPQRVEMIWHDGERRTADFRPGELIHVGDRLTLGEKGGENCHLLCLDEHDEHDGTHVVGVCLREHYGLITLLRALDGEPIVAFDDLDDEDDER
jgi:hypothetical protein